jgi:hypothetical protein
VDQARGRTAINLNGPQFEESVITQFVFGGPNIYVDLDANGFPNNDVITDAQDPKNLYILRPNGIQASPPGLLVDTGYVVPLNTWLRFCVEINPGGQWNIVVKDNVGATLYMDSGIAVETTGVTGFGLSGTSGLDIQFGQDPGGAGRPKLEKVQWDALGNQTGEAVHAAGAEDGGDGSLPEPFNNIPAKYWYQEIRDLDLALTPDLDLLPDVQQVNQATGLLEEIRPMEFNDIVVLLNDTGTAGMNSGTTSITGTTIADNNPRNTQWQYTEDFGATILGEGLWTALGLPGDAGLNDPVPAGALATSPPYNLDVPFRTMIMGTIVDMPPFPATTPPHGARFDDLLLDLTGCIWDVAAPFGEVSGSDLAVLLAAWTPFPSNPAVDGNSDGVIDGADLAGLLAAWGPCPSP